MPGEDVGRGGVALGRAGHVARDDLGRQAPLGPRGPAPLRARRRPGARGWPYVYRAGGREGSTPRPWITWYRPSPIWSTMRL